MARELKNVENETQTLCFEKHSKACKMRNTHCGPGIWLETLKT